MKDISKAAPPLELVLRGGDPERIALWGCGTCRLSARSREDAISCCAPWVCEKCGKETKSYCEACSKSERLAKAQARHSKAKKVMLPEYAGSWLFCDCCDEYYADVDSLLDAHEDAADLPAWAWATTEHVFSLDAEEIVSDRLEQEEFYEGAFDNFSRTALVELQVFLDAWAVRQNVTSYMVDYEVAVVGFEAVIAARMSERAHE